MNIIQLIEREKHWRDLTHSPRKSPISYQNDIQIAISDIVRDRYDNFKTKKGYSFESTQNLRDQLQDLVRYSGTLIPVGNVLFKSAFPVNYRHLLAIRIIVDGKPYWATPTDYDRLRSIDRDPFEAPTLEYPEQVYYAEAANGLNFNWGRTGTMTGVEFYYLAQPTTVLYGTEWGPGHNFVAGNTVIATMITVYNSVTYPIGSVITIVAGILTITSGTVVFGYVNTDLPELLHEEISLKAAEIGMKITENYNKSITLDKENEKQ